MRERLLLRNSQSLLSGSQAHGRGLKAVNSGRKSKDRDSRFSAQNAVFQGLNPSDKSCEIVVNPGPSRFKKPHVYVCSTIAKSVSIEILG